MVEGDDRASEGLAHLQAAAREAIAAARAFLDVAEDLIADPSAAAAIADAVGSVVRTAAGRGGGVVGGLDAEAGAVGGDDHDHDDGRVQRIRVS